jgi:hypothetical protein
MPVLNLVHQAGRHLVRPTIEPSNITLFQSTNPSFKACIETQAIEEQTEIPPPPTPLAVALHLCESDVATSVVVEGLERERHGPKVVLAPMLERRQQRGTLLIIIAQGDDAISLAVQATPSSCPGALKTDPPASILELDPTDHVVTVCV